MSNDPTRIDDIYAQSTIKVETKVKKKIKRKKQICSFFRIKKSIRNRQHYFLPLFPQN